MSCRVHLALDIYAFGNQHDGHVLRQHSDDVVFRGKKIAQEHEGGLKSVSGRYHCARGSAARQRPAIMVEKTRGCVGTPRGRKYRDMDLN